MTATTFAVGTEFKIPKGHKFAGRYVTITGIDPLMTTVKFRTGGSDDDLMAAGTSAVRRMFREALRIAKPVAGDTVTVFRIEHISDGVGCYGRAEEDSERGMQDIVGTTIADARHPTMGQDSKLRQNVANAGMSEFAIQFFGAAEAYSFGFSSIDQLRAWMFEDAWLAGLSDQHYILAICEVQKDDVIEGNTQCMFIRPKEYEKKNLREYFGL